MAAVFGYDVSGQGSRPAVFMISFQSPGNFKTGYNGEAVINPKDVTAPVGIHLGEPGTRTV